MADRGCGDDVGFPVLWLSICRLAVGEFTSLTDPVVDFTEFVERNGTVGVSSINTVTIPPGAVPDMTRGYGFSVARSARATRKHALESLGGLPRDAEVRLRLPLELARQLHVYLRKGGYCDGGGWGEPCVEVPLLPNATSRVGEGVLRSALDARCELLVRLPAGVGKAPGRYDFAVRQTLDGKEVGRVTWRFVEQPAEADGPQRLTDCVTSLEAGPEASLVG